MAEEFDPAAHSHRRCKFDSLVQWHKLIIVLVDNPLTGDWTLVSDPHRMKHPWNGQVEPPQSVSSPEHDPNCYLCPENQRANGQQHGYYEYTKLFPNDYASVIPPPHPVNRATPHPLLASEPVVGACDVLVFHPRHDLTLARLSLEDIARIVDEWICVYKRRGSQESIKYVQIFEVGYSFNKFRVETNDVVIQNKGAMMGCSNPHPHGQIWSLSHIPTIAATELASLKCYAVKPDVTSSEAPRGPFGRPCLLCEYTHYEMGVSEDQGRVVVRNEHFVALVPWWAVWPFELFGE
jgi:UDPglucose--hexose-1-phosphate uridylyltransferase